MFERQASKISSRGMYGEQKEEPVFVLQSRLCVIATENILVYLSNLMLNEDG
jgi:hypothetical protein